MKELEKTEKMLAFYMGEARSINHPIEKEYEDLVIIYPRARTSKQKDRLAVLSNAILQAVEVSDRAFRKELDKFVVKGKK